VSQCAEGVLPATRCAKRPVLANPSLWLSGQGAAVRARIPYAGPPVNRDDHTSAGRGSSAPQRTHTFRNLGSPPSSCEPRVSNDVCIQVVLSVREGGLDASPPPSPPPSPPAVGGEADALRDSGVLAAAVEDIPGVPRAAWRAVRRGPLSSASFQPGAPPPIQVQK
jgi:hypothetical protein